MNKRRDLKEQPLEDHLINENQTETGFDVDVGTSETVEREVQTDSILMPPPEPPKEIVKVIKTTQMTAAMFEEDPEGMQYYTACQLGCLQGCALFFRTRCV